jgi:hypothetical protein
MVYINKKHKYNASKIILHSICDNKFLTHPTVAIILGRVITYRYTYNWSGVIIYVGGGREGGRGSVATELIES